MGYCVPDPMVSEAAFLAVEQPLDLRATLESGQVFRWRRDEEWYWGVIGQHAYALRQVGGGLLFLSSAPSVAAAKAALHDYLRLDDDLKAICREMATDEQLAQAVAQHHGLRLLRQDPWECLVSFVCSSVSTIPNIGRTLQAVAEAYGEPVAVDGRRLYRFPDARRLARVGEGALRGLGLGFRARYVAQIAPLVAEGRLDLVALRQASYEQARAALVKLPGVGEKVADCVLLFSLDKPEAFPIDRWVRRALVEWYGHSEKARYGELRSWAQGRWGHYAGYAQQYLYHHRRLMG